MSSLAECGEDEEGEKRGWSAGERGGRSGVVGEKKVQGSKGRGCDKEKTQG
jgi:hypothetical protein